MCRVLRSRGCEGRVEFFHSDFDHSGLIVRDLVKYAGRQIEETAAAMAHEKAYRPFSADRVPSTA